MKATLIPTAIAATAVLGVLLAGVWNLVRRNPSPSLSQNLMRWRVALQLVAIIAAMLALYAAR